MKHVLRKLRKSITNEPCFNITGTDINDPTIIANSFNDYFVSIGSKLADDQLFGYLIEKLFINKLY